MADIPLLRRLASRVQDAIEAQAAGSASDNKGLLDSIERLRKAAEPASVVTRNQRYHTIENVCLLMAIEMGLISSLVEHKETSLSAAKLSELTGFDEIVIVRVMRMIVAIGFADESGYRTYQANEVTMFQNQPGINGSFFLINDMLFPTATKLRKFIQRNKPLDLNTIGIPYQDSVGEHFWSTLESEPKFKKAFDDSMATLTRLQSVPWHHKYPIMEKLSSRLPASSGKSIQIVDMGGNRGYDLARFLQDHPDFPGLLILQDLPQTLASIEEGSLSPQIQPLPHDFFTPQPIRGADIYLMKSIIHDWSEVKAIQILSEIAKAMSKDSRLLLTDMVFADTGESALRAGMDMLMFCHHGGMERTLTQWKTLLHTTSPRLELIKVWSAAPDQQQLMEVVLAEEEEEEEEEEKQPRAKA